MADIALTTFAALVIAARLVVALSGYRSGLVARQASRRMGGE